MVVATAVLLALPACGPASAPEVHAVESQPTEVALMEVDQVAALLETPQGAHTVVNLWATWCPPCIAEMPELAEFYRERDPRKVRFVSLSYDKPADLEKVRAYHEKTNLPFSVYVLGDMETPEDIDEALGTVFGGALPTTYIFDAQGKVVKEWEGAITLDMLQDAIRALG